MTEQLAADEKKLLTRELRMAQNACTRCGRLGHFSNSCDRGTSRVNATVVSAPQKTLTLRRCAYCLVHGLAAGTTFNRPATCASCGRRLLANP